MDIDLGRFAAFLIAASIVGPAGAAPTAEQLEFFEKTIRPIFAEHCYSCHSDKAEKLKGDLRLDTSEALLHGGSSGPAIVPGDAEASLLIKAVRYTDPDLQMPPKNKKLALEQIASLEAWVKMGAPLPASTGQKKLLTMAEIRAKHWAFQPVTKPILPPVKKAGWVKTPVDRFILAKLEAKQLKPASSADRRTLIRRVTYDLTGLPPTYEQVESFIKDKRPDAHARVVDRLLASPQYGERWGRYWLDVARYADTKGYLAGGEERRYAFSHTYRDYVIAAYNRDKPYDQFVTEQIAADRLPQDEDRHDLAALGFLTLGRRFLNNQNDIIDDRIDVVTRGMLGLTVTCARCHDHKFDPISSKDYYALHGVFASSEEPADLALLGALQYSPLHQDYLKQKSAIENEIVEFKEKEISKFYDKTRERVGDYLLGAHDAPAEADSVKFETFAGERELNPIVLRRWTADLEARSKKPDAIYGPWLALAKLEEKRTSTNAAPAGGDLSLVTSAATNFTDANPIIAKALAERTNNSLKEAAGVYTKLFKEVEVDWRALLAAAKKDGKPPPSALPDREREALRQALYTVGTVPSLARAEVESIIGRRLGEGSAPLRNKIEALSWTHPGAPPRAMAVEDRPNPGNSHVMIRGNPGTPGEEVPRRFIQVLSTPDQSPFTNGSGRLELARAIANRDNPLTARVYVNRVWLHHFGVGLVSTPGDFGIRTEEPVQHALLDYLAASFMESGWSTKALHRLILLSATYQQSSDAQPASVKADPENRLLSHMNRERLDFEALRDTLLAVAGKLDPHPGGPSVDLQAEPFSVKRTVYGFIDRQNLPGVYRTFDFANPDVSNQGRFHTTVPQQALFLMNSPFVIQQAKSLAQLPEVNHALNPRGKIEALYRVVLQRPPGRAEVELAEKFIARQPLSGATLSPIEKYAQVLLLSNEVTFVD